MIGDIETKENSELNGKTGIIKGVNSDGTYIVNITEGAGVSVHTIDGLNLTPISSIKKYGKVSSDISSKFTLIREYINSFIEEGLIDHNIIIKNLMIEDNPLILLSLNIAQKQAIDISKYPGNAKHKAYTKIRSKKELSKVKYLNSKLEKVGQFRKMLTTYQDKVKEFTNRDGERVPQIIIEEESNNEYAERLRQILDSLFSILNDVDIPIIICLQEINPLTVFQGVFSSFYEKFNLHHHNDTKGTHSVLIHSNDLSVTPIDNNWLQDISGMKQRPQKIMGYNININDSILELHNIHTTYFENKQGDKKADMFLKKILKNIAKFNNIPGPNKIIVGDANLKLSWEDVNKWEKLYKRYSVDIEFIITPEIAYLEDGIDANPTYDVFISYLN